MVSPPERVGSSNPSGPGAEWPTRTLCGRPYVRIVTETGLDLLGDDVRRVCKSCWHIVERWLSPPPVAEGEADVLRWIVAAVLEIGEAMVEGVPVPRLESIRRRVRSELKSTIGGSVHTHVIGATRTRSAPGWSSTPGPQSNGRRNCTPPRSACGLSRLVNPSMLPDGVAAGRTSPASDRHPTSRGR